MQINEGLDVLFGVGGRDAVGLAIVVIAVLTLCFIVSAASGVHRGIQWLSNTNMILAAFLVLFLFFVGPTVFSRGSMSPRAWNVVLCGTFTGAAAICLLAGAIQGSVDVAITALQSVAIASAAPFVLVLIGLCFSILKVLRSERLPEVLPGRGAPEPGRAMSRPQGAPSPQQMSAEDRREQGPRYG